MGVLVCSQKCVRYLKFCLQLGVFSMADPRPAWGLRQVSLCITSIMMFMSYKNMNMKLILKFLSAGWLIALGTSWYWINIRVAYLIMWKELLLFQKFEFSWKQNSHYMSLSFDFHLWALKWLSKIDLCEFLYE